MNEPLYESSSNLVSIVAFVIVSFVVIYFALLAFCFDCMKDRKGRLRPWVIFCFALFLSLLLLTFCLVSIRYRS
jgi:Na+/melibiose symporter-like transporter